MAPAASLPDAGPCGEAAGPSLDAMSEKRFVVARPRAAGDDVLQDLQESIAVNVRALRIDRGLSITELADAVGISKAMLSKIENAQTACSLATLGRLASGLGVPASSLLVSPAAPGEAERGELITMLGEVIRRLGGRVG